MLLGPTTRPLDSLSPQKRTSRRYDISCERSMWHGIVRLAFSSIFFSAWPLLPFLMLLGICVRTATSSLWRLDPRSKRSSCGTIIVRLKGLVRMVW